MKNADNNENKWVVASEKEFEEAQSKGLYKGLQALSAKRMFFLCPNHITNLIQLVNEKIEEEFLDWHTSGGGEEDYTKTDFLKSIERLLYVLEDLYPYFFEKYILEGKFDYKKWSDENLILTSFLLNPLSQARELVSFPPMVEQFYQSFELEQVDSYKRSHICGICGRKNANLHFPNIHAHEECVKNRHWQRCSKCNWLYPKNKVNCEKNSKCKKGKLIDSGSYDFLNFPDFVDSFEK